MIEIGTNFSYKGPLFLDDRHGIAKSKLDLLNWSIPVPEGFEVYLDLENDPAWYTYNSRTNLEDTGHFKRRIDEGWVTNEINEVNADIINIRSQIDNIWDAINNIEIQPNLTLQVTANGGMRVLGTSIVPEIAWVLKNYETPVDISDISEMSVNGIDVDPIISPWTNNGQSISSSQDFILAVTYNDQTVEQTISYTFEEYSWYKYFGTSSQPTLTSINDIQHLYDGHGWGTPSVAYEGTADCSGGKYPYYIIPSSIYNAGSFKMYIGGFRTSDYITNTLIINGTNYTTIRTGYIQTGSLQIRYE